MRHVLTLALLATALAASAQEAPAAKEAAGAQDIEPAVTTSSSALTPPSAPASAAAASAPAADKASADKAAADRAAKPTSATQPGGKNVTQGKAGAKSTAHDQIELDRTQITGNSELPNVMYVVPWKRPELGDLGGRPAKSLVDEALAPVDRDVFRRQNRYFTALQSDSAARPAAPAAPAGDAPR